MEKDRFRGRSVHDCPLGIEKGSLLLKDCPDILCPLFHACKEWNRKKRKEVKREK